MDDAKETTGLKKPRSRRKVICWIVVVSGLAGAACLILLILHPQGIHPDIDAARQIILAYRAYAEEHDGEFPPTLDVLTLMEPYPIWPELLYDLQGEPRWIYVPGYNTAEPDRFVGVLFSRKENRYNRGIIGFAGGNVVAKDRSIMPPWPKEVTPGIGTNDNPDPEELRRWQEYLERMGYDKQ